MHKFKLKQEMPLHLMVLFPLIIIIIYAYGPMVGILMAFQDYIPSNKGFFYSIFNSPWVGLSHFKLMFMMPDTASILFNTVFIATMKIISGLVFPLIFALLLNEMTKMWFKKLSQTITFFPFFLSWVILGGILLEIFSPRSGVVNNILQLFNIEPIYFFGNPKLFPFMMVLTDLWKGIGYNTIIYLAALTAIDPTYYEAAVVDGASRWKQTLHITIPGISSMVALLTIMGLGGILNAGFDQIFMLYNPAVYSTGDVLDTYVYRLGIQQGQYAYSTAVGLLKGVVSLILVSTSNFLVNKYSNYRVF